MLLLRKKIPFQTFTPFSSSFIKKYFSSAQPHHYKTSSESESSSSLSSAAAAASSSESQKSKFYGLLPPTTTNQTGLFQYLEMEPVYKSNPLIAKDTFMDQICFEEDSSPVGDGVCMDPRDRTRADFRLTLEDSRKALEFLKMSRLQDSAPDRLQSNVESMSRSLYDAQFAANTLCELQETLEIEREFLDLVCSDQLKFGPLITPLVFCRILDAHCKICRHLLHLFNYGVLEGAPWHLASEWITVYRKLIRSFPEFFCGKTAGKLFVLSHMTAKMDRKRSVRLAAESLDLLSLYRMVNEKSIVPGSKSCEEMIYAVSQSSDARRTYLCLDILKLFKRHSRGEPASVETYKFLLMSCCNLGSRHQSSNEAGRLKLDCIWEEAIELHGHVTPLYEGKMKAMLDLPNKRHLLRGFLDDMFARNVPRNIYIYNIMIRLYSNLKNIHQVTEMLMMMRRDDIKPSKKTFVELMGFSVATQNQYIGDGIFQKYVQVYGDPSIKMCNLWISAKIHSGSTPRYSQVFTFLKDMVRVYQIKPSTVTFQILMSACSSRRFNDPVTCKMIFDLVPLYDISIDWRIYSCLIRSYLLQQQVEEAEQWLREAIDYYRSQGKPVADTLSLPFIDVLIAYTNSMSTLSNHRYYVISGLAELYYENRPAHAEWMSKFKVKQAYRRGSEMQYNIKAVKED